MLGILQAVRLTSWRLVWLLRPGSRGPVRPVTCAEDIIRTGSVTCEVATA